MYRACYSRGMLITKRVRIYGVTAVLTLDRDRRAVIVTASKPVPGFAASLKAEAIWGVWT